MPEKPRRFAESGDVTRFIQDKAKQIPDKDREKAHEAIHFAKPKTITERM